MLYAELHCLTNFSFLCAASHPDEVVIRAAQLGYSALAITDINTVAGIVRANTATKDHPLHLIVGSELRPVDAPPIVVWVKDRQGYGNLCRLITLGRRRAPKGECHLTFDDIVRHTGGLLAGVAPPPHAETLSLADARRYRDLFGESAYLLAELHQGPHDQRRLDWLQHLSQEAELPLVAAGNVLFHDPERKPLQDVLTAIRLRTTVALAGESLEPNAQRHLRSQADIQAIYADIPEALERTRLIARQCTFSLSELRYEYPEELAPPGLTPIQHLRNLAWSGAHERYSGDIPGLVRELLHRELDIIEDLRYEPFFLTVWDVVRFARSRGILCQGRGSAANSTVCYCLGVTAVDPVQVGLLFERFMSKERNEAPDIDVDFEHERREEVLQYLYEKYGRDRAGLAAVTITYRPRSAIRDVGKALGFSLDLVDRLAKSSDHYRASEDFVSRCREAGLDIQSPLGQWFLLLVTTLQGFPRHLSQHVGGMVITRGPLDELVPIENASMEGRTVVQWNKDDLDDLGILKVDCLALGMLTAIRKCFELVQKTRGRALTLANIPQEDPSVYDMICRADTMGVFQIESRAQMAMLPRLKPRTYYDLVIEVAIVRPGPIQGNMVHPYLRRRAGLEEPKCPDILRPILGKTLGVSLFQEQCMQIAMVAADFTAAEADELRRAMGAWRRPGLIDQYREKLLKGMLKKGFSLEFAEQIFQQIRGFGEYGFPEAHAASFALLVYVSAWLKHHCLVEFTAAMLNSQPMGFYAPAQLIQNARRQQVTVLPVDVNASDWDSTVEEGQLRLGFRMIKGIHQAAALAIVELRAAGPFASMPDFLRRAAPLVPPPQIELLAEADALARLNRSRRDAVWNALSIESRPRQQTLFDDLPLDEPEATLPVMSAEEEVRFDYNLTGLSLRSHPVAFHREELDRRGILSAAALPGTQDDSPVTVAGIVLMRQRPATAKEITFVTLEDETGTINLIVHIGTWTRFRQITRHSQAWIVQGKLQNKEGVVHVVVERLEDLTPMLASVILKSRDFH
ncbi:error-prone DNA polymerase [Planctomyces sp. SH-PL14]|uniref:error-prone DNA polymerase n=1 Tax=Planctomyces sp. SH-PL14 TaxID=1632864 RepID=UPI00078B26BC|nr:error-prone DNA polymerase [Planctomyces sp. SH-PL14]AMV21529.1 Error-prone DNA polymerase [Planctomyces sp. SH-PL14]